MTSALSLSLSSVSVPQKREGERQISLFSPIFHFLFCFCCFPRLRSVPPPSEAYVAQDFWGKPSQRKRKKEEKTSNVGKTPPPPPPPSSILSLLLFYPPPFSRPSFFVYIPKNGVAKWVLDVGKFITRVTLHGQRECLIKWPEMNVE